MPRRNYRALALFATAPQGRPPHFADRSRRLVLPFV